MNAKNGKQECTHLVRATPTIAYISDHNSTCKLLVSIATAPKLGDEFACQLEDEHSACFVVDNNHMTILVHRDALWPHQSSRAEFSLIESQTEMQLHGFKCQTAISFVHCLSKYI